MGVVATLPKQKTLDSNTAPPGTEKAWELSLEAPPSINLPNKSPSHYHFGDGRGGDEREDNKHWPHSRTLTRRLSQNSNLTLASSSQTLALITWCHDPMTGAPNCEFWILWDTSLDSKCNQGSECWVSCMTRFRVLAISLCKNSKTRVEAVPLSKIEDIQD